MTPKHVRIVNDLIKAKGEGVLEIDLLNDYEGKANTRQIRRRARKFLGSVDSIAVSDGRWYVAREYWEITPMEIRDLVIAHELARTRRVVLWSMGIALVAVFIFGVLTGLLLELNFEYV